MQRIKLMLLSFLIFLVIDLLWLSLIAKNLYTQQLAGLLSAEVIWPAAIAFYIVFIIGMVILVIEPALQAKSAVKAAGRALLYGLVTYATYDLTNLATLKGWPLSVTIIDLIWGMSVSLITVMLVYAKYQRR